MPGQKQPALAAKISKAAALFLLILFALCLFHQSIEAGDIWWHLAFGKHIFENGRVAAVDPFPFAGETTPWILPQWLGSFVFYLAFLLGGLAGLIIFRDLVFIASVLLFLSYAKNRIPFSLSVVLAILLIFGLETRCYLRPDIFNFIFVPCLLALLFDFEKKKDFKKLLAAPLMILVWNNLHLGGLVYGFSLISLFFIFNIIKDYRAGLRPNKALIIIYLACAFALLISP